MKRRSIGVIVLGIFFIIWGMLGIWRITSFGPGFLPAIASALEREGILALLRDHELFSAILGCVMAVVYLASGIGVVLLKNWARRLFLAASIVYLTSNLLAAFQSGGWPSMLGITIWYGLIMWFLLRPSVKAQFVRTAISDQ